jgi:hypothetical protein
VSSHKLTAVEIPFQSQQTTTKRTEFERLAGGGYVYRLPDEGVWIEIRYLRRVSGAQHAEIDVCCNWAAAVRHGESVACADLNLSSQPARRGFAAYCAERTHTKPAEFDWPGVIDAVCLQSIQAERRGDNVIVLDDAPDDAGGPTDVEILPGFNLPTDASSFLIAHGDSLKSLILLYVLGTLAYRGENVLLLDWEWTAQRHKARKRRLFGDDRLAGLHYLRCYAPLTIEADRIRRFCEANKISFCGIDSVGVACDGKLIDDDVAIRFHRALAALPPSVCAAHVPKSSLNPDAKTEPTAFGSVYFTNLARMAWNVTKQPSTDDLVTIGLFPKKQNDGPRQKPVGIEFSFEPTAIAVRPVDVATVDGLAERLPLRERIMRALHHGPKTYAQLADELDPKVDSIIKTSKRSDAFTRVPGEGGVYRLALVERRAS